MKRSQYVDIIPSPCDQPSATTASPPLQISCCSRFSLCGTTSSRNKSNRLIHLCHSVIAQIHQLRSFEFDFKFAFQVFVF